MTDDYTPSMAEIRRYIVDCKGPLWTEQRFDRAIAAHDAELRAEIAAQIRAEPLDLNGDNRLEAAIRHRSSAATIAKGR